MCFPHSPISPAIHRPLFPHFVSYISHSQIQKPSKISSPSSLKPLDPPLFRRPRIRPTDKEPPVRLYIQNPPKISAPPLSLSLSTPVLSPISLSLCFIFQHHSAAAALVSIRNRVGGHRSVRGFSPRRSFLPRRPARPFPSILHPPPLRPKERRRAQTQNPFPLLPVWTSVCPSPTFVPRGFRDTPANNQSTTSECNLLFHHRLTISLSLLLVFFNHFHIQ